MRLNIGQRLIGKRDARRADSRFVNRVRKLLDNPHQTPFRFRQIGQPQKHGRTKEKIVVPFDVARVGKVGITLYRGGAASKYLLEFEVVAVQPG